MGSNASLTPKAEEFKGSLKKKNQWPRNSTVCKYPRPTVNVQIGSNYLLC